MLKKIKVKILVINLLFFVISGIPSCALYHRIRKKTGYFFMYCLSVYLIQIQNYHAFYKMAVDHWCLSLRPFINLSRIKDHVIAITIALL